jgi:hypothetical protein
MSKIIKDEIERIAGVAGAKFIAKNLPALDASIKGGMNTTTFMWGHPIEIVNTLGDWTKHDDLKFDKFPLIALFTDIPIFKNKYGDYDGTLLEIIIATGTERTYDSPTREIKTFAPILRPLYTYFMEELERSNVFAVNDVNTDLKHEYNERFFWGKQGIYGNVGNVFNDFIDAIQIRNLDLKVNVNNCY